MDLNTQINRRLTGLVTEYFNCDVSSFDMYVEDTFDADVGTGNDLIDLVKDDIHTHIIGANTASNLKDLKLTAEVMQSNPNDWFVYSLADSLAKPLTLVDVQKIQYGINHTNSNGLITDEIQAKKQLKALK